MDINKVLELENENVLLRSELQSLYEELDQYRINFTFRKSTDQKLIEENNYLRQEILQLNQRLQQSEQQKQVITLKLIDQQELNIKLSKTVMNLQSNINEAQPDGYQNVNQCTLQNNQNNNYVQQLQVLRQRYQNKNEFDSQYKDQEIQKLYVQLSELQKLNNNNRYTKPLNKENLTKSQYRPRGVSENKFINFETNLAESRIYR
ncbi:unnamed protein product (macronuclear) [Paramecium tetraurelia]|uniref:Uncharacterized protein n=1 Tax=Paramecium tetraurelia TaxID=5888 RepID=A0DR43_PARTE|nr:uncharacterized protein GSPATT00002911001 [Paramecium tetraurelia]CAK85510.1 unnamed protein product [Paramecium tetraurelia]|eukprot:XP_001452907.1 hypothetical protein (macronuclear) [Paramecium tetraurelia strain d4-2]